MSKTSETKNKILLLLKGGNKRLIDIYPLLGLSAATVSQHLKELKQMGLIREIDNSHFKNEKYYTLDTDIALNGYVANRPRRSQLSKLELGAGIVAIALIAAGMLLLHGNPYATQISKLSTLNIMLTDPPHVPIGTKSLNITYSSIQVHLANASGNGWTSVNATGTINLISLINISKMIGSVGLPTNSVIDTVAFNITGARITIGNTSYPVELGNNRVLGQVSNVKSFNGTSDLLVDFSPTILTIYGNSSTVFEMAPAMSAVMVAKHDFTQPAAQGRGRFILGSNVSEGLKTLYGGTTIINSSVVSTGNRTKITILIADTSNRSIDVEHVLIFGNESLYLNQSSMQVIRTIGRIRNAPQSEDAQIQANGSFGINPGTHIFVTRNMTSGTATAALWQGNWISTINGEHNNASSYPGSHRGRLLESGNYSPGFAVVANASISNAYDWSSGEVNYSWDPGNGTAHPRPRGQWVEVEGFFNVPRNISLNSSDVPEFSNMLRTAYNVGLSKRSLGVVCFSAMGNGTLIPLTYRPYTASDYGYMLKPGQSAMLTFNGTVGLGSGLVTANFTRGVKYTIEVISDEGVYAKANVIAG